MSHDKIVNSAQVPPAVSLATAGSSASRAGWVWALLIAVLFCVIAWQNLGFPSQPVFDEIYTVTAAQEYAEGMPVHEQTHPPLSKLLMAAGYLAVAGGHFEPATTDWSPVAFSARVPGVLLAGLSLMLLYALGRTLFSHPAPALIATGLLALDGLFLVFARTAMTNIYGLCFLLLGTLGTCIAIKHRSPMWLLLAGVGFGCAMASRWTAAVGFGLNATVLLGCLIVLPRNEEGWGWQRFLEWIAGIVFGLIVVPMFIYLISYVPQVVAESHHELNLWPALRYIVELQGYMVNVHTIGALAPHATESPWWSWPLMLKPVWFFSDRGNGSARVIFAVGNAAIWWASLPVLVFGGYKAVVRHSASHAFVTLLAAGLWLVWAIVGARATWMHYYFETIPFVCLLLGSMIWQQFECVRADLSFAMARAIGLVVYGAAVIGWSVWFFPLETARPISDDSYFRHMVLGNHNWEQATGFQDYLKKYHLEDPAKYKAFAARNYPNPEQYLQLLDGVDAKRERDLRALNERPKSPLSNSPATTSAPPATDAIHPH